MQSKQQSEHWEQMSPHNSKQSSHKFRDSSRQQHKSIRMSWESLQKLMLLAGFSDGSSTRFPIDMLPTSLDRDQVMLDKVSSGVSEFPARAANYSTSSPTETST